MELPFVALIELFYPVLLLGAFVVVFYSVFAAIYNLYFHPLAGFPGPFLARSSLLWRIKHSMRGRFHRSIEKEHQFYGKVFRVSPNELSFASTKSYRAIYGPWPGQKPFVKGDFYDIFGAGFETGCIGSERNPASHARMKRLLSPAFSTKALAEQEIIIQSCVDGFINRIQTAEGTVKGLNMTDWYEMIAFDILGEMAFGESFYCIKQGHPHFWQQLIAKHLFLITLVDNLRRYPFIRWISRATLPWLSVTRNTHSNYSRDMISRRLASESPRKDFLSDIIGKIETGEVSREELTAHASTLVIAGGETVAAFMAIATFHLCKSPIRKDNLYRELRARFKKYSSITSTAALQLPYLQACISEGLRIYPPSPQGLPRTSPGAFVDGFWIPEGTEIYTSVWTVSHDATNFERPYEFLPERWLDPSSTDIKDASQPFSCGPRGCIGRNFAYMEMSLLLAKLVFTYDMELLDPGLDFEGRSHMHVQWWKPELQVMFIPRKNGI